MLTWHQPLPHTLAVAWSGGLDSTALLWALKEKGFHVQAWHVDHAWHDQSDQDALLLERRAKAWGIPFFSKRLPKFDKKNREAQARQGRYAAFQALSQETGIQHVALAHHADDQAETVCMRMLQGAGVMGVRGMQVQTSVQGLHIYRPWLHVRKHTIKKALQAKHIPWLEDNSNTDTSLWRNKIRLHLLPAMLAQGVDAYVLMMRWQQQAVRLSHAIERAIEDVAILHEEEGCRVDYWLWQALQQPMRVQVIQKMAAMTLGVGKVLGRRHMVLIECWRQKGARAGLDLSGCRLYRQGEGLHLHVRTATSRL